MIDRASIEKILGRTFSLATHVQLLWKGKESFRILFDAVRDAEKSVCLQFYIFRNDETGTALSEILKQKRRQGIRIYLLYDHFGSIGTPGSFWQDMRRAGIQIRASHPFKWTAPFHYVHRDHRKLIIIDSRRAFTGGLNIADEYSGFHLRKRRRGWRDTGIILEGAIVQELFETFRKSWHVWGGEKIEVENDRGGLPDAGINEVSLPVHSSALDYCSDLPVLPIFAYSGRGRRRIRNLLRHSIRQSEESICLTTAYFIPSGSLASLMESAVKRGVRVRLLVPGSSDVPAASYAGKAFFSRLLKAGVEIYTYRKEILHAKTYLFDRTWSIIGSTNLDYQSLIYNDEGNVGILDPSFGSKMMEMFEEDLKNSEKIDPAAWKNRPFFERLGEHFFALFRKRL